MQQTSNWYVLRTRSGMEKKVAQLLVRKGVECYCPLVKTTIHSSNPDKTKAGPLFKSQVFIQISPDQQRAVNQMSGVIGFVYWLDQPLVVPPGEIAVIRQFAGNYQHIQVEKIAVRTDGKIKITEERKSKTEDMPAATLTLTVVLPSLGYKLVAETKELNVKVIDGQKETTPAGEVHSASRQSIPVQRSGN